jgi:alpha-galactosidase
MAVEPAAKEMETARRWSEARFAGGGSALPFSFLYEGKPARDRMSSWKVERTARELDRHREERTITWTDTATGLRVRSVVILYRNFPAVEWVLHFANTGPRDTPILENVLALDADFASSAPSGDFTLHYADGSHERITDFRPQEKRLAPGELVKLASFGGRSSDGTLPFFNLAGPGSGGTVIGVGWTGQWAASFARRGDAARVQAGMELTHLSLHPGEEIRSPAVLLLFWDGTDPLRGQNLLRRLLRQHYTPAPGGKLVEPPCAASPHGKIGFEATTETNLRKMIDAIASRKVPFDTWWIDAGWYACGRNWARYVGNPDPDPGRYPSGMKPVADAAHRAGMRFLLWFEPERVMPDTWLFNTHPEWLLKPGGEMPAELRYQINDRFHLLDLGNPAALAWAKTRLSAMIASTGIDCYRNDFNMYPLYYWRNQEPPDRQGIREIRYVTGLYDLFDTLKKEHPNLLIDNCASGGRRIDFEMLRRALVLTRSDYLWDPIGQQCHTFGLARWIPITGIGAASTDVYSCRSGLGSHFALAADYDSSDAGVWAAIARAVEEQRSLRRLYAGDFHPLGPYSTADNAWLAWQFHREDLGEGLVQAFRRRRTDVESTTYRLRGLEPEAEYRLTNLDEPKPTTLTGRELMERGLTIRLPGKPSAAVFTYRKVVSTAGR